MKVTRFLAAFVGASMAVACSAPGSRQIIPFESVAQATAPNAEAPYSGPGFRSLYSFGGVPSDGTVPYSTLIAVNGALYGTTLHGGTHGYGSVFRLDVSGKETALHNFDNVDGAWPSARLTYANHTFYGTTTIGAGSYGEVFQIDGKGRFKVLHRFLGASGHDGECSCGSVFVIGTSLYGTAYRGPYFDGSGIVYRIDANGNEHILKAFFGPDGALPLSDLIFEKNALWGTTSQGGTYDGGTVFSITLNGAYKVIHNFGKPGDANDPYSGLVDVNGTMYGTTYAGGVHGKGTVYSIRPSGREAVLYSFDGKASHGCDPTDDLISVGGALYGTTLDYYCGKGTVFKLTTSGKYSTLNVFRGPKSGAQPYAGLTALGNAFYGVTSAGGSYHHGMAYSISL